MRDVAAELKELRLYGLAGAWEDVAADGNGVGVGACQDSCRLSHAANG